MPGEPQIRGETLQKISVLSSGFASKVEHSGINNFPKHEAYEPESRSFKREPYTAKPLNPRVYPPLNPTATPTALDSILESNLLLHGNQRR